MPIGSGFSMQIPARSTSIYRGFSSVPTCQRLQRLFSLGHLPLPGYSLGEQRWFLIYFCFHKLYEKIDIPKIKKKSGLKKSGGRGAKREASVQG